MACRWMNTTGSPGDTGTSVFVLTNKISIKLGAWSETAVPQGAEVGEGLEGRNLRSAQTTQGISRLKQNK